MAPMTHQTRPADRTAARPTPRWLAGLALAGLLVVAAAVGLTSSRPPGGADPDRGSGLIGLSDRVQALGGRISVRSPAGEGTTLEIDLPVAG